jgi:hypothetical protein
MQRNQHSWLFSPPAHLNFGGTIEFDYTMPVKILSAPNSWKKGCYGGRSRGV